MAQAAQVNREPLERLLSLFGGNIYTKKRVRPREQQLYTWAVTGSRARGLMMTMYVLLSQRRRAQVLTALTAARPSRALIGGL